MQCFLSLSADGGKTSEKRSGSTIENLPMALICFALLLRPRYAGKLSASSEKVTDSFVDNAVTIMTRVIVPNTDIKKSMEALDNDFGFYGPLCQMSKLLACAQKASTPELIRWTFFNIIDLYRSGELPGEGISERALRGHKGQTGLVDLFNYKHACNTYILGPWLGTMLHDNGLKDAFRNKMNTHVAYRANVNPLPPKEGEAPVALDMSWQKGWPHGTTLLLQFIECVLYGRMYDASLRAGIKSQKTVAELFEFAQPMKEAIEEIRKANVAEQTAKQGEASHAAEEPSSTLPWQGEDSHSQQLEAALANSSTSISLTIDVDTPIAKFVAIARRKIAANVVPPLVVP